MDVADDLKIGTIMGIDDPAVEAVICLGDANRKTLGFLPRAGYIEAAARQSIVVATAIDEVVGYCLYDSSGRFVRIVHLCVAAQYRGSGVARRLVDHVEAAHPHASGIRLKCRRDWPAAGLWPILGFRPMNEVPGRSRAGLPLTIWWKPLEETPDLFTPIEEPEDEPLAVALDSNVFSDLHCEDDPARRRLAAPVALLSGDQRVRLVLPHCAVDEVNHIADGKRRKRLLSAQHGYEVLNHTQEALQVRESILRSLDKSVLESDPSLRRDAWLVAESATAGCDVFLTRDENAIHQLGPAALDRHGLAMMLPSELPDHVRRREDSGNYRPANLAETGVATRRDVTRFWSVVQLDHLLNRDAGERKVAFRERLRNIAEASGSVAQARFVAVAPGGDVLAAWAFARIPNSHGAAVRVPLLRAAAGPLSRTLARQILFSIRTSAASTGASRVILEDPQLSSDVKYVLSAEGFTEHRIGVDSTWVCTVISEAAPWETVIYLMGAADLTAPSPARLTPTAASELERHLWPLKITDAPLASYLIPIRGPFADELLGHAPTLIPRDTALGLSRENVYYRAPSGQPEAPARILWYSSRRDRQVVACSRLVEAVTGEPDALHREFRRLGVWSRTQVRAAARGGRVGAIRFADTEVLPHPVELDWIRNLSYEGARLPSQGPRKISGQLFTEIYRKGRWG